MAGHVAVLCMISALGISGADATCLSADATPGEPLGSATVAQRSAGPDVPAARPPVPFLRQPRPASSSPLQPETPEGIAEDESQEAQDMEAAKAAIERDGYRRVMVLGRASNGNWRAKAYRGVAEVFLTVRSDGTVATE